MDNNIKQLSEIFSISPEIIKQIISLLEEGNTVPFIARYRKQSTDDLDDQTLRKIAREWQRLEALSDRKSIVMRILEERQKLNPKLAAEIKAARTVTAVEDLYRPFKRKKQTRASKAIEQGLKPLADYLLSDYANEKELMIKAKPFLATIKERESLEDVLQGAGDILAEQIADRPDVRSGLRKFLIKESIVQSKRLSDEDSVYGMYYDYQEKYSSIEAHRWLAMQRGEREGFLRISLLCPDDQIVSLLARWLVSKQSQLYSRLFLICQDSWKRLLYPSLKNDLFSAKSNQAEDESIELFSANLKNLLLQAPIRDKHILGWDPGYINGCKLALIDQRGEVLSTEIIYPFESKGDSLMAEQELLAMLSEHPVDLVALGNGTASRESELWIADFISRNHLSIPWLIVSEAGASVYSASETAALEFPDLDVNLRSAVSIARRVQDPLAELVKIEPKAIGVGQYQHDLNHKKLESALADVVEDCVNQVGVDLNTASTHILSYVAGLNQRIAEEIVAKRQELRGFTSRDQLKDVKHLGPKTFEQAAGFLRIADAPLYLDRTAVHPESYLLAEKISEHFDIAISTQLGEKIAEFDQEKLIKMFDTDPYTLDEIQKSLLKPNRDPRDDFSNPSLKTDILKGSDLKAGMVLSGTVRNVVAFGAFVDVGIEHDGLVHISKMAENYVKDPMQFVKIGQTVEVEVVSYDAKTERLELSMIRSK